MDTLSRANSLVDNLLKVMRPVIVSDVRRMFVSARKRCNKKESDVLLCFQQELEQVGMWGNAEFERMRLDVIERGKCSWVQDLLNQVVEQYAALAFVLKVPELSFIAFAKDAMLACCRQFWICPQLFYDRVKPAQQKRNEAEINEIILSKLRETVALFVHHSKDRDLASYAEDPIVSIDNDFIDDMQDEDDAVDDVQNDEDGVDDVREDKDGVDDVLDGDNGNGAREVHDEKDGVVVFGDTDAVSPDADDDDEFEVIEI